MRVFAKTDLGKARDINEDFYYIASKDDEIKLYILADGMGGYNGGEIASRLTTASVKSYIETNFPQIEKDKEAILKLIGSSIEYANMIVYDKAKENVELEKDSYIKRVIALPGEHVEIKGGNVYINEQKLDESYLPSGLVTDVVGPGFDDFVVPENCVFAMGDNRSHSTDCRAFGCIPLEKIESKVWIRIWPLNLFGKVK